jgi:hypothetical protein
MYGTSCVEHSYFREAHILLDSQESFPPLMENKHLKGFHFHTCPGEKHLEPDESSSRNQVLSFL